MTKCRELKSIQHEVVDQSHTKSPIPMINTVIMYAQRSLVRSTTSAHHFPSYKVSRSCYVYELIVFIMM